MVLCFKVCHPNDEEHNRIAEVFREFCRRETQNNYLMGIKKLLEAYSTDWKYETLSQRQNSFDERLASVEKRVSTPKERTGGPKTFGGKE